MATITDLSDLSLPPRVEITSFSTTRVGKDGVMVIEFEFDQPVVGWVARVGSRGALDGKLADAYAGPPVTSGQATIHGSDLQHGDNEVQVYGRSVKGTWSLREPVE